ncbi:hypothetical protein ACLMPM_24285 [Yersinia enterocolitica]|uniref:hypothetical protein n=1 Tax=Yersinia enterocolitica TaxID=630 RepID=UPI00398CCD43
MRVNNGIIKSVFGYYDEAIVAKGYYLDISKATPSTRFGSLVIVRDTPSNSAELSIAITQMNDKRHSIVV